MNMVGRITSRVFTGFVPQIIPDKVPNIFHFIELLKLFFVFSVCVFLLSNREGASTHPNPNPNPTLAQAGAPTRARLRRAFWKN